MEGLAATRALALAGQFTKAWLRQPKTEPLDNLLCPKPLVERDAFGVCCLDWPINATTAVLCCVLGNPRHDGLANAATSFRRPDIELFQLAVAVLLGSGFDTRVGQGNCG